MFNLARFGFAGRKQMAVVLSQVIAIAGAAISANALAYDENAATFTIVAIPDPQYYTNGEPQKAVDYYNSEMNWIVANRDSHNIAFVSGLGDLQQDGDPLYPDGTSTGFVPNVKDKWENGLIPKDSAIEWERAYDAWQILAKTNVPFYAVAGNHDYLHWEKKTYPQYFQKYFGPDLYKNSDGTFKSWIGGFSPENPNHAPNASYENMNNYSIVTAGGKKFLMIGLQFLPDANDVAWAQSVIDAHKGLPTIVSTHDYQDNHGRDWSGKFLWTQLIEGNSQIFMVLSGHVSGVRQQISTNRDGLPVYEMLSDYQDWGVPGYANGGGYFRLINFDLKAHTIHVQTFSPLIESKTGKGYMTTGAGAEANDFTLDFDYDARIGQLQNGQRTSGEKDHGSDAAK